MLCTVVVLFGLDVMAVAAMWTGPEGRLLAPDVPSTTGQVLGRSAGGHGPWDYTYTVGKETYRRSGSPPAGDGK